MGEKSAFFTVCFSSVREGLNIIIRGIVGFCFGDRDFVTSSPPITSFSFSEKEKEGKRKTAQGTAPLSEPRFAPADRDEIKSRGSMRLRPPRPPGERASRVRQTTEMLCTAEKVSVFGAKPVCSVSRAARPRLWLPLEGKAIQFAAGRLII